MLQQHDLVVLPVGGVGGGQLQYRAQGVVLGHLADIPDVAVIVDGNAVGAGVVGVGGGGHLPVDQQGEHDVCSDAQADEDGHGGQQLGSAALGGGGVVDVVWHEIFSLCKRCSTGCPYPL